ncbi:hypothetical protein Bbelb_046090 [Branchiostoma belcheri]|nr:hypothetical protein Bbelb_046090 [Branchiostoma belcheri]
MRLLLYICLVSAVVSLVRSQAPRDGTTAQLNLLAALFRSEGLLQQKTADTIRDLSTVNGTSNVTSLPAQPIGNISQQCRKDVAQYQTDLAQEKTYAMHRVTAFLDTPRIQRSKYGQKKHNNGSHLIQNASGILEGNLVWAGRYSQCVSITGKDFNITFDGKFYMTTLVPVAENGGGIAGVTRLMVGVCVPSSCTQHDVIQQLDGSESSSYLPWKPELVFRAARALRPLVLITATGESGPGGVWLAVQGPDKPLRLNSPVAESPPIQGVTIAAICICSVVLLLNAIGTIYDVIIHQPRLLAIKRQKESEAQEPDLPETLPDDKTFVMNALPSKETPAADDKTPVTNTLPPKETPAAKEGAGTHIAGRVLLCFSLYTNIGKLLSTKQAPGSITCLHGIRFISLTWVILAHTYGFARNRSHFDNPIEPFEIVKTFTFQAVNNSFIAVDSFFFLSGLLMSYVLMRQIAKKQAMGQSVPYGMVYFHRYWRLTPTYMFVLMLYMWVLPYMFSGPFWPKPPNGIDPNCGKNWWTNLLYINNLVNSDKECMDWTWYLANDMQFFVIGVPLVYILYRLYWPMYYVKPYCRIGPYLVGVFVGWMLNKIKRKPTNRATVDGCCWLVAAASAVAVLYSPYGVYQGTAFKTEHEHVLYVTLHRTVWGMALGWVVLACYYGYGGVVDIILSWKALVPLSKLTYCAYLGHLLVVLAVYLSRDLPIHFTSFSMIYFFLGHVTLAYAFAFLVSVAVEIPLVQLETIIFKR